MISGPSAWCLYLSVRSLYHVPWYCEFLNMVAGLLGMLSGILGMLSGFLGMVFGYALQSNVSKNACFGFKNIFF